MALVKAILSHPAIFPHIHEDGSDEADPQDHEGFHWMLVSDDQPAGVFLLHAVRSQCYEVHTCLLPRIWGQRASIAAQLLIDHVFNVICAQKLITNVPAKNRPALRFAKASGLVIEGVNRESFMRDGVMEDQIMLGITKKEWESCQQ